MLFDAEGGVVASIAEARFAAAALKADRDIDRVAYHFTGHREIDSSRAQSSAPDAKVLSDDVASLPVSSPGPSEEAVLLLDAAAQRAAFGALQCVAGPAGSLDFAATAGPLATVSRSCARAA